MSSVFRNKSIKRISSPEQLNQYVEISGRFSWGILIAVIIFIAGVLIWSFTGRVDTKVTFGAVVSDGVLIGCLKEEEIGELKAGAAVYIDGKKYTVSEVSSQPKRLSEDTEDYVMHIGRLTSDSWVYEFKADCKLTDGIYRASAVTESIRPVELILK